MRECFDGIWKLYDMEMYSQILLKKVEKMKQNIEGKGNNNDDVVTIVSTNLEENTKKIGKNLTNAQPSSPKETYMSFSSPYKRHENILI